MTSIKAIETRYAGCRFRSRLEARWAVFFDTLGIKWEYEPQGIQIPTGECKTHPSNEVACWDSGKEECVPVVQGYLPDFWLPGVETYVEVKGSDEQASPGYLSMLADAIDFHATPLWKGLLLLGPIPDVSKATFVYHHYVSWAKGVYLQSVHFQEGPPKFDHEIGYHREWELKGTNLPVGLPGDGECTTAPDWPKGASWNPISVRIEMADNRGWWPLRDDLRRAYTAARSARFEHGEHG